MTMAEHDREDPAGDDRLEEFFAAARGAAPAPDAALLARVLAGAEAVQGARCAPQPESGRAAHAGWLAGMAAALGAGLGGWRVFGGMATAALAGIWIGYAGLADNAAGALGISADPLIGFAAGTAGTAGEDPMPGEDDFAVFALALGPEG